MRQFLDMHVIWHHVHHATALLQACVSHFKLARVDQPTADQLMRCKMFWSVCCRLPPCTCTPCNAHAHAHAHGPTSMVYWLPLSAKRWSRCVRPVMDQAMETLAVELGGTGCWGVELRENGRLKPFAARPRVMARPSYWLRMHACGKQRAVPQGASHTTLSAYSSRDPPHSWNSSSSPLPTLSVAPLMFTRAGEMADRGPATKGMPTRSAREMVSEKLLVEMRGCVCKGSVQQCARAG